MAETALARAFEKDSLEQPTLKTISTDSDQKALHTITYGNKIYNYLDFIGETA